MRKPARILVVDDNPANRDILAARLGSRGYEVITAADGVEAVEQARQATPDLILLDVMMPRLDGLGVCRILKNDPDLPFMPIILVTARSDSHEVVEGLDAGGDEYLTKPVDHAALTARVRSLLRLKALHDRVSQQAAELAEWSRSLEARVAAQVEEITRISRLRRFLAPQLADIVVSGSHEHLLDSHRRDVTVVFCDLRGFTAFADRVSPEELMAVLADYHRELGALIRAHAGTLERFMGDGLVVIFNDPLPCPAPETTAARMAVEMRSSMARLAASWRARGHRLGFGVGIAHGPCTLGRIGFEGRDDYAAIGPVANLAARLCDAAADGEILVDATVWQAVDAAANGHSVGQLRLKGIARPVDAFCLDSWRG